MKFKYYKADGTAIGEKEFDKVPVMEEDKGISALKDLVVAYQAALRQGNAFAKNRAEVSGTGKKPWRQKGTGMARHGSKRTAIWRGGSVVHGPRPRSFTQKMNKKIRILGLKRAFYDRANEGAVNVIDSLEISEPKTKAFISVMKKMNAKPSVSILLIDEDFSDNTILSARNLPNVFMIGSDSVNAWDFIRYQQIVITELGLTKLLERING